MVYAVNSSPEKWTAMLVRYYSQRMLNPFRGLMYVVETENADAVTVDGIHWDLYVDNIELLHEAYREGYEDISVPDIKFGTWSRHNGLTRAPLISTLSFDAVQAAGEALLNAVRELETRLPFPGGDDMELWLLDHTGQPLALLNSRPVESSDEHHDSCKWIVGQRCRQSFRPGSAGSSYGEWLESRINAHAGPHISAQWFLRNEAGGCATGGCNIRPEWQERQLAHEDFPELLVRSHWNDPVTCELVADYLDWLAPWLLQLPDLCETSRARLEKAAWKQAQEVESHYVMYPRVIDEDGLRASLVKARLISSNITQQDEENSVTPPYYIEL